MAGVSALSSLLKECAPMRPLTAMTNLPAAGGAGAARKQTKEKAIEVSSKAFAEMAPSGSSGYKRRFGKDMPVSFAGASLDASKAALLFTGGGLPLGHIEGVQYLLPFKRSGLSLSKDAKAALAVYNMPHIVTDEKHKAAYEGIIVSCQCLDEAKDALSYWKRYLEDYVAVMAAPPAIPSCIYLASIEEMERGFGLFATQDIATNTFLGCFTGQFVAREEVKDHHYAINVDESYCVDPTVRGNFARFINHSEDNPNLSMKLLSYTCNGCLQLIVVVYTIGSISQGEQLLFDYGRAYDWSDIHGGRPLEITPQTYMLDLITGRVVVDSPRKRKPKVFID